MSADWTAVQSGPGGPRLPSGLDDKVHRVTTTRRLLAAALLTAALTTTGTAAGAQGTVDPGPSGEGVRVTVEIDEREAPEVGVVLGDEPLVPGGPLVVRGRGHAPGSGHDVALLAGPVPLGAATAGADGAFELTTRLPEDTAPGVHRIRVTARATGAEVLSAPFTVVAAGGLPTPPGDGEQPGTGGPDAGGPGTGGAGAPGAEDPAGAGTGTGAGGPTAAAPPGRLAATGVGLAAAAALAGVAVASGVALRRRAGRGL